MGVGRRVLMKVLGDERIRLGWWDWGHWEEEEEGEFRFFFRRCCCCCSFFLSAV